MDNYRGMIEKHKLVVTRAINPYNNDMEWCVGKIYYDGTMEPKSYGKTIEEALDTAYNLIKEE